MSVLFFPILFVLVSSAPQLLADDAAKTQTAEARRISDNANACAQKRPECWTATPTVVPSATPRPTIVPSPIVVPTLVETAPSATPLPGLPVPATDTVPVDGYLRPSTLGDPWIELAVPQGRWNILIGNECQDVLVTWTYVSIWQAESVVQISTRDFAVACQVGQAYWQSSMPCATNADKVCDVNVDAEMQDMQPPSTAPPVETDVPTAVPTATPQPPSVIYVPIALPPQVIYIGATQEPQVEYSTPVPPPPTFTPVPTSTPSPTTAATNTPSPTSTAVPTPTPVMAAYDTMDEDVAYQPAVVVDPEPEPVPVPESHQPAQPRPQPIVFAHGPDATAENAIDVQPLTPYPDNRTGWLMRRMGVRV